MLNLNLIFLNSMVQKEPGKIIGPISFVLGKVMNVMFNLISNFTEAHALGLTIIMFTLFTRIIILPLTIMSNKSTQKMQKLNPEIEKIRAKYPDKENTEQQQKMNQEIQTLYAREKINPMAGCLPLFIQFPVFFALTNIMQNIFLYIDKIYDLYVNKLAATIISVPNALEIIKPIVKTKLPTNGKIKLDLLRPDQLAKALNKFTDADWKQFIGNIPEDFADKAREISTFLSEKNVMDSFIGLNLTEHAGLRFPGILIPILSAVTSFLTQYIMIKQQEKSGSLAADNAAMGTQKTMLMVMPIMMGFITITTPVGVGLYWISGNLFLIVQQLILNKINNRAAEVK